MHLTQQRCAQHPWQPPLGACDQCGQLACVLCGGVGHAGANACGACARTSPLVHESLEHDRDRQPWLHSIRDTSLSVWRTPYRTFARLSDGAIDPAWNLCTWWWIGFCCELRLLYAPNLGLLVFPIVCTLIGLLNVWLVGGLFYLMIRALGGATTWSLALRAQGYVAAWLGPAGLIQLATGMLARNMITLQVGSVVALLVFAAGSATGLTALGRAQARLSPFRAIVASLPSVVVLVHAYLGLLPFLGLRPLPE